ncbi:MAG: HAD-IIA family hydrolase [Clostridia bacterium]|nr:HAD-IIA family hydrolase [Clostridia bacterium]
MALKDKKLFLLDMDGTIYLSQTLFDGTLDLLAYIKRVGGKAVYLTNNSSRGLDGYIRRMEGFGIEAGPEDFVTSTDATIAYLKEHYAPQTRYFVCGTESLKRQLRAAGLVLADHALKGEEPAGPDPSLAEAPLAADVVLLGYDTELTYAKLEDCCVLLNRGADYVATHPDLVCPVWYGSAPDCGSIIRLLETATGRRPVVIGKPQPAMAHLAMRRTGFTPEETVLIGDRVYTDIACGVNAGIDTIFVLSGEGVPSDIEKYGIKPAYIYENIREVVNDLEKEDPS